MWAKDGSPRDPVRLFEEFLNTLPLEMRTSGLLYLTIIQRLKPKFGAPNPEWERIKLVVKALAQPLNLEGKRISNHST